MVYDKIPPQLRSIKGFLVWKYVQKDGDKKPRKIPFYVSGGYRRGTQGSAEDRDKLATFNQAIGVFNKGGFDGIGLAMLPDWNLVGLDFDNCVVDGVVDSEVLNLVEDTYAEISPSGHGIRAFMIGEVGDNKDLATDTEWGFETFCSKGFLTLTGDVVPQCELVGAHEELIPLTDDIRMLCALRFSDKRPKKVRNDLLLNYSSKLNLTNDELKKLLDQQDPNVGYSEWIEIGMALHHETDGGDLGFELYDEWSSHGASYPGSDEVRYKWDSFGSNSGVLVTARSLLRKAKSSLILDPKNFMDIARNFLNIHFSKTENKRLIRFRGEWYQYLGTHYEEINIEALNSKIWRWLSTCLKVDKEDNVVFLNPTRLQISTTLEALQAQCILSNQTLPAWLSEIENKKPYDYISLCNGILYLPTKQLIPHTIDFFTFYSLPYDWIKKKNPVLWIDFLNQIFSNDQESIDTLQEIFGYLLTADTSQQKIFLIKGPKRSGKGTIGRILTSLIGKNNIVSPALGDLTSRFGLQPLIGKLIALIPDARIGAKTNKQPIVERLLMVSGEDTVTVDRKHKEAWSGKLGIRFVMLTNELPNLKDVSGALAGRFVVLITQSSFFDKEDTNLTEKLEIELPHILHWAIEGRERLLERGRFIQPKISDDALSELNEINSPILSFVRERCELGAHYSVSKDDLYSNWCQYCSENGQNFISTKAVFGKELRDAVPEVTEKRSGSGASRKRMYCGIRLKPQEKTEFNDDLKNDLF